MTLGEKISSARNAANLKQTELAEKIEVTDRAVRFWESDERVPDFLNVCKIAKVTQLPLDYFAP